MNIKSAVYTVDELAAMLNVSPWTVYERVKRGEIPGVKRIGKKIRFIKAVINEWLGVSGNREDRIA